MKRLKLFLGVVGALSLAACSSAPVKTSPDDSHWRLRNTLDDGFTETVRVYNYCYRGKQAGFIPARDFKEGSHSIVARITQHFNHVESKPREGFVVLSGDFESGKTYAFQNQIEDNEATVWIADVENSEAVTPKEVVVLGIPDVVDHQTYKNRRCKVSTL